MQYNHKSKMTFTKPRYMIIIKYIQKTPLFKNVIKNQLKVSWFEKWSVKKPVKLTKI